MTSNNFKQFRTINSYPSEKKTLLPSVRKQLPFILSLRAWNIVSVAMQTRAGKEYLHNRLCRANSTNHWFSSERFHCVSGNSISAFLRMCVVNGKSLSLSTSKRKHRKYFSLLRGKFSTNRRRFLQLSMAQLISILSYNFVQLQFFCAVSLIRPRFSFLEFITKYPALKMKNAYKSYIFLTISHPLLMVMVQRI